jgi:hypothetical protein
VAAERCAVGQQGLVYVYSIVQVVEWSHVAPMGDNEPVTAWLVLFGLEYLYSGQTNPVTAMQVFTACLFADFSV